MCSDLRKKKKTAYIWMCDCRKPLSFLIALHLSALRVLILFGAQVVWEN